MEEKNKEELVRMFVKVPKSKRELIYNVVAKSSYNNASELIRAGIDKELNLQIYKDNMDVIIKELSKLIDIKLDSFIKSQRKLNANNVRISALNTYIMGEVMSKVMGDELHQIFMKILESGRVKANYFVSRNAEEISKEELLDFYGIGKVYHNE
jgi:Arc/MetJ-type ribon-helix-helix transcriptional regulator